jgi:carboxymethylenebutenolidase
MTFPGEVDDPSLVGTNGVRLGDLDIYIAHPTAPGSYPALVVLHEAFGVVEHIEDVCRRLAAAGYVAAAPDLYSRVGAPSADMESVLGKMFGLADRQIVADCDAVAAALRARDDTSGAVGIVGFCMGGRATTLTALSSDRFDAAAACWGGFITRATFDDETTAERPVPVVDLLQRLDCPMMIVGGAEDENPAPEDLRALHDQLQAAGKDAILRIYEGAGHAFLADYRDSYCEGPAFELWDDLLAFFGSHLR